MTRPQFTYTRYVLKSTNTLIIFIGHFAVTLVCICWKGSVIFSKSRADFGSPLGLVPAKQRLSALHHYSRPCFFMRQVLFRTPVSTRLVGKPLPYRHPMSTKPQFLVLVNDFPGTIEKRIEVRQAHLSVAGQNQAVRAGGLRNFKIYVDIRI